MVEFIPKWINRRYVVLRKHFGTRKFSFKDAQEVLDEDSRVINLLLSNLKKKGWMVSEKDPEDPRKKLYQLKRLEEVYKELEKNVEV